MSENGPANSTCDHPPMSTGRAALWAKIRSLVVFAETAKRTFFYGINLKLGYELPKFSDTPWGLEIRPIIAVRNLCNKEWELTDYRRELCLLSRRGRREAPRRRDPFL
jgi:hypothetical protein